MVNARPTVYKTSSVYKEAGGGVLPDDIILYEYLENIVNNPSRIYLTYNFNNDNKKFLFALKLDLSIGRSVRIFDSSTSGNSLYLRMAYPNISNSQFEIKNCSAFSSTFNADPNYINNKICLLIYNNTLKDYYNNVVIKNDISYTNSNCPGIKIPGASSTPNANELKIYRIQTKDYNDAVINDFYPAKKLGIPGLFDIKSSTFCKSSVPTDWDCFNPII